MFAAKSLKLVPKLGTRGLQSNVLSGPPRVHITPMEKLAHGVAIAVGICTVPAWVLVNIKNYRAQE
ncbi:unnamed protein product [Ceutorhynchus assimilis]|uniref:Uncharacterized protein n=1 Tax=Ceutorhynchus assimilis TaxID=467358 RepID=A0A9N9MJA3_9CUCU|nr:unnamed protein product [Ceutorhynchus assimilis]